MKIEINLDEARFNDLVSNGLERFSDEEIHDILTKAISQYVVENDIITGLFYKKKRDWYGKETNEIEPTYRLQKLLENLDVSEQIESLKASIDKVLKEDDMVKKLVEGMFCRFIAGRLQEVMFDSSSLQQLIQLKVNEVLDWREGQKQ